MPTKTSLSITGVNPDLNTDQQRPFSTSFSGDTFERKYKYTIVSAYHQIKDMVIKAGFTNEIQWQSSVDFDDISESDFLREHAWVTLSAGMREFVIRRLFDRISSSFYEWKSTELIVKNQSKCRISALRVFNNARKISAMIDVAEYILSKGFNHLKADIYRDPLGTLQSLPFIGPITRYHLAKNIGLQLAKPDRHLTRLANSVGCVDVQKFCEFFSFQTGDSIPVVDIVLWRYSTITDGYLEYFLQLVNKKPV